MPDGGKRPKRFLTWVRKQVPGRGKSSELVKDYRSGSDADSKPTVVDSENIYKDSVQPSVNNTSGCLQVSALTAQPSVPTATRAPSISRGSIVQESERLITPAPYNEEKNK
jgi:hypothetical protein